MPLNLDFMSKRLFGMHDGTLLWNGISDIGI